MVNSIPAEMKWGLIQFYKGTVMMSIIMHHASCIMHHDVMKYDARKYDVMKYDFMKYDIMKYDVIKYDIIKMKKPSS